MLAACSALLDESEQQEWTNRSAIVLLCIDLEFKHLSPSKRRKKRQKFALPIVKKFFDWFEKLPFYGKNALAKAAEYTLNRANGLKAFLKDGRIEIDNNPVEKTGSFPSVKLVQKPTPSV
ncbi:transposase [Bacillus sp. JJ1532]|uniref:IS66 family transposase n=1 Tax=Bacillus sp. JJ1532 TaxID=3122958 RepID=UPI002FFE95F7